MTDRFCKKCGDKTSLVLEDSRTGEVTELIDYCRPCLFGQPNYRPLKDQITLIERCCGQGMNVIVSGERWGWFCNVCNNFK